MRIGDKITGTITGIKPYGAFVALDNGTTGLIHISEIKTGYIENIYQLLSVGEKVLVQVVDLMNLRKSKFYLFAHWRKKNITYTSSPLFKQPSNIGFQPLADNLPKWTKESLELLNERINKNPITATVIGFCFYTQIVILMIEERNVT